MLKKLVFFFFCIFLWASSNANLYAFSNDKNQLTTQEDVLIKISENKSDRLTKITTLLSVSIIGIFSILTLVLLKNINYRSKANKLLQEKNNELRAEKEKAEKANQAKAEFLSTITHELRTPLYAVTGLTHLLLEGTPTKEQKEHLNSLRFSGEYLLSLINNILDLNKLEANKVIVEYVPFNLKKRIHDVFMSLQKAAAKHKNQLNFEYDPEIPKKLISDPLKISQILINLIGNAIKFTKNGRIDVRIKRVSESHEKIKLLFEIEDNGNGISKEHQENIFNTFSQETLDIHRKYGGSGLGLSIVKKLLEILNSSIQLESEKGKGSKFFFELDFKIFESAEKSQKGKVENDVLIAKMKGKKALVVEDNKLNQMITCKILNKNGIITDAANDGEMAVEKCKNNDYDIILMDINMPGISGFEASKIIRSFNNTTPILALTAVTLSNNIDEFYNNGISDIIPKPYKVEDLFSKINKAFESTTV